MTRLPRALTAHPWIVYAVLTALAFPVLEMLLHGEAALQYAHDVFDDDVPRLFSIAADWRAHGPVLWNPHLTAGNALVTQFALPPVAPDVLLSFVVSPLAAYAANTALMTFAAGTAMHLFLRDSLRLPAIACFAGGIIATFAFWHYIYGYGILLLPLVLWATDRALADGRRRRDIVGAILVVAFLLLSSQVQVVVIDGVVALAWVLATRSAARPAAARVANLAVIWAAAALLAAPILASQLVALPSSQRAIWDLAYLYPLEPMLREVARLYGGVLLGVPVAPGLGGSADIYGTYFLGPIGLALLAVGIAVPRRSARERLLLALLVAIPVVDVLALLAVPLQEPIGVLRSFQIIRVRHLLPVVLIANAAIGVAWLAGPGPLGQLGRRRRIALGALVVAGLAVAWQGWIALRRVRNPSGDELLRDGWSLALAALAGGTMVLLILALWALARRRRAGWERGMLAGGLAVTLLVGLAGERLVFARAERNLAGNLGTWAASVALTPAQAFIAAQPGGGRVVSIGEHANRNLVAGLDGVDGYSPMYPLRYHELFGALIAPQLELDPIRAAYYRGWGNRVYAFGPNLDPEVADLLGVRWLYVRDLQLDDPALVARFTDGEVTVYENPGAFPRAFVAREVAVLPDRAAVVSAVRAATTDELRDRAYLAAADVPPGFELTSLTALARGGAAATLESDGIDRITVRTRATSPAILVLADAYTPDWTADVDGIPAQVLPVDGALRGVVIPAGEHVVTFRYRPMATYLGLALALATAVTIGIWLALGWRRAR